MNDVSQWLGENAIDLIGLLGALALLGVTAWYAVLTKRISETARDAAAESARATAAAERAADAALDAARVAQSQIRVEFTAFLMPVSSGGRNADCVRIGSEGDPVVVRQVTMRRAFQETKEGWMSSSPFMVNEVLTPFDEDDSLPKRLHAGEDLFVTHLDLQVEPDAPIRTMVLAVDYAFSEDGVAGGTREIVVHERGRSRLLESPPGAAPF